MKSPSGYRIGIVNSLTLVGEEIKTVLRDRGFPFSKIVLLDSTGQNAGALTEAIDEPSYVVAVSDDELEDLDLVFFCGSPDANREWIERAGDDDFAVIDLSQPTATEGGKLVVDGINLDSIDKDARLLVSPHPVAIPIALILEQLATVGTIESCVASVVQPASEFGHAGVEALALQTVAVLNVQSMPKEVFDRQLAFNLYPAPARQEEFIVGQIRELLDTRAELALFVTQGTIFHGHTFSLFVKLRDEVDARTITSALSANSAIALQEGDQQFGTTDAAGRNEVLIAEVRTDPSIRGGVWIWAVCDNLRRSAALNAVLAAEKVLFGTGVQ